MIDDPYHGPDGCPHGDDPAICPPCRRAAGKDKPEPTAIEFEFTARYSGDCTGCNLPIHVGQRCARMTSGRTVHVGCAR